ncbi:MAG: AAA domain-containing protein [Zavarzinella sp.]
MSVTNGHHHPDHAIDSMQVQVRQTTGWTARPPIAGEVAVPVLQELGWTCSIAVNNSPPVPLLERIQQIRKTEEAEQLTVTPAKWWDAELDTNQQQIVQQVLSKRDLMIIDGPPGTGKSRTALEIIRQYLAEQKRVLWLWPTSADVDHCLQTPLVQQLLPVRLLASGENRATLPIDISAWTAAGTLDHLSTQISLRHQDQLLDIQNKVRNLRHQQDAAHQLMEQWHANERAVASRKQLEEQKVQLAANVEQNPPAPLAQELAHIRNQFQQQLETLTEAVEQEQRRLDQAITNRDSSKANIDACQQQLELKDSGKWWNPTYWLTPGKESVHSKMEQIQTQYNLATLECNQLEDTLAQAKAELQKVQGLMQEKVHHLLEREIARQSHELDQEIGKTNKVTREFQSLYDDYVHQYSPPADLSVGQLEADCRSIAEQLTGLQQAETAHLQAGELITQNTAGLADHLLLQSQLVVGAFDSISHDPWLQQLLQQASYFDLVVLEEAQFISTEHLNAVSGLGHLLLLTGDSSASRLHGSPDCVVSPAFSDLIDQLAQNSWKLHRDRLQCQLQPVPEEHLPYLEAEPVTDHADYVLWILNAPDESPELARIDFPLTAGFATAKAFVANELDLIRLQPILPGIRWETTTDSITVHWGPPEVVGQDHIDLGKGVREHATGPYTIAVEFATDAGWTLESARAWIQEHLPAGANRVAHLIHAKRACTSLACWLKAAFGFPYATNTKLDRDEHVMFLPVPKPEDAVPAAGHSNPRGSGTKKTPAPRLQGAGFEVNLAERRERDTVPVDIARQLPQKGCVNYREATALISYLEDNISGPVVLTSPIPEQVELLRLLCAQSKRAADFQVLPPNEAARTEAEIIALSLTRSHRTRAVSFGASPSVLANIARCARKRLIFAGDPGTLARRMEYTAPVDHLNEQDSERERVWVRELSYCQKADNSGNRRKKVSAN